MNAFRRLVRHFSANHREAERRRNLRHIAALRALLARPSVADAPVGDVFAAMLAVEERKARRRALSFFTGRPLARWLIPARTERLYAAFERRFAAGPDTLDIDGMKFPKIGDANDRVNFFHASLDILFPGLLEKRGVDPEAAYFGTDGYDGEGSYEQVPEARPAPGDVVIDAGANMGVFSALAGARGCAVHAFEPIPYVLDHYLRRVAALNPNITVHPYALSDREGELAFALDRRNIGASHALDAGADAGEGESVERVRAISLDRFVADRGLERVDFIKADIEGAERAMLAGARETLRRFAPTLAICTYHLPDDPEVLRDRILAIRPDYTVAQYAKKLYAYLPGRTPASP